MCTNSVERTTLVPVPVQVQHPQTSYIILHSRSQNDTFYILFIVFTYIIIISLIIITRFASANKNNNNSQPNELDNHNLTVGNIFVELGTEVHTVEMIDKLQPINFRK